MSSSTTMSSDGGVVYENNPLLDGVLETTTRKRKRRQRTTLVLLGVAVAVAAVVAVLILVLAAEGDLDPTPDEINDLDWDPVDVLMRGGVNDGVFPGAAAVVGVGPTSQFWTGTDKGIIYQAAVGHFTYGEPAPLGGNPQTTLDTLFDMASLTKVLATTTAVAQFYQRGEVGLDTRLADESLLGAEFSANGKEEITVRNMLLHNAGLPPDPVPGYWEVDFGCPASSAYHPNLTYSCQDQIYASFLAQTLDNPVGEVFVYSDLSFIGLAFVVGKLAESHGYIRGDQLPAGCDQGGPGRLICFYGAYIKVYVLDPLAMVNSGFLPAPSVHDTCPPVWNDTVYRHEIPQGVVSDENAYAMGGISGHAGLFSTATETSTLVFQYLVGTPDSAFLNSTTIDTFATVGNVTQSNRALGWAVNVPQWNGANPVCKDFSSTTIDHTGYTGTSICIDLANDVYAILLTNRCYPVKLNFAITAFRAKFAAAVAGVLDLGEA